jgi:hypothetical protein
MSKRKDYTMDFTYWGDLLGISGYYRLNPTVAKAKLNDFYNTTFYSLSSYCESHREVKVLMFSDSLLMYGEDALSALKELCKVYVELIRKGLLLRGGMVKGKLEFEPRYTLDNFQKQLPTDDTLARTVGLENAKKGARLLLERELAAELLADCPDWLTHEGYVRSLRADGRPEPIGSILRRIAPTPEQDYYECLYFWVCYQDIAHNGIDYAEKIKELEAIRAMLTDNIAEHYKETVALLKRCQKRQSLTAGRM